MIRAGYASAGPFGAVDARFSACFRPASNWDIQCGLTPRDLAMNVALPELDGRLLSRAVGFKSRHP